MCTDHKAQSFIHSCALTSSNISRWILQLQEFDLRVRHIRGVRDFLADTISRNPDGMSEREINGLTRPRGIVLSAVGLGVDGSVGRKLKDLHIFQAKDPKFSELIGAVKQEGASNERYLVRREILYAKNESFPYYRPVLPAELEDQVIIYVHKSLGHLGAESIRTRFRTPFM